MKTQSYASFAIASGTIPTVGVSPLTSYFLGRDGLPIIVQRGGIRAGIIASGCSSEMMGRRKAYRLKVTQALQDGVLSSTDKRELKEMREELGLQEEETELLEEAVALGGFKGRRPI